jgi:RimJ/RimL family protein N-acetyltransferase
VDDSTPVPIRTQPVMIRTERLLLHPFTAGDLDGLQAAVWGDPLVTKFLPGGQPRLLDKTQKIVDHYTAAWERPTETAWAVVLLDSGRLIGECGLSILPDPAEGVEVFYALAADSWGKGYATELARACLRFGFETFGQDRLRAVAVPDNTASRRVMEKLGMIYDGLFPYDARFDENLAFYSLARAAFDPSDHPYTVQPVLHD